MSDDYDPWIWSSGKQEPVASVCIANIQNFHAQKNTKRNKSDFLISY